MSKIDRRWIWIGLGVLTIISRIILGYFPEVIEQLYSRGLFVVIRYLFDYTIGMLPVALIYVLIFGSICFVLYRIFQKKNIPKRPLKKRIISFIFSIFAFLSAIVFLFLLLWGFNYARVPIEKQIGISPQPLDKEALMEEFLISTDELITSYGKIKNFSNEDFKNYIANSNLESNIRNEVGETFENLGYPNPGRVRARYLYPKGVLLRISTAGFYFPLTGECHLDPGLHPLQIPYVMAHEFAHGFGIGDEGSCNFIAYLTCSNSADPVMNYTGLLSYWRSIAYQYRRFAPEHYKEIRATLPQGILDHIKLVNDEMDKYPDLFPAVRDATYNAYLKTQGIEEGMKNYSRVVLLVQAYRKK